MMVAFLSHSSKDKWFVGQVAANMGPLEIAYDEQTFEYVLNVQAIRSALKTAELVVFFLSKNSISSSFVKEEQRQTLEALGRGDVKRVLIFALDDTSYKELPDWLREINVVYQLASPKACARRIQALRLEIAASERDNDIYLGRDLEEGELRRALSAPADRAPIAIHAVGFHGIGRRTFLRNSLNRMFPRYYGVFLETTSSQYQSIDDLYRSLYHLHYVSSRSDTIDDFERFSRLTYDDQVSCVVEIIREMADRGEFIAVVDEFGVYDDSGDFHQYWADVLRHLSDIKRPVIGFIQTRMMPQRIRSEYPRDFHQSVGELDDTSSHELVALSLKMENVDFTDEQLNQLVSLVDGHPLNLSFAVRYAKHYGIESFLKDPRDFIEWKHKRGEDFLRKLEFSDIQSDIIAAISEYRHLSAELIIQLLQKDSEAILPEIRALQDYCCVEFRHGFFHLAAPIREATRRDDRFERNDEWRRNIATRICDVLTDYESDDNVPVPILESAVVAQAKGGAAPEYLTSLILPSHLLNIARELYDKRLRPQCISFCKRAFEMRQRMTSDAQVETLRLWALSAARANDTAEFEQAMSHLENFSTQTARRVRLFLEGFSHRIKGRLDLAETKFNEAWKLSPMNAHINRELAQLYCRQKRYDEGERFARQSYNNQPTNPFIIDILLETLIGKKIQGQYVDNNEVARLRRELDRHSRDSGTSFHLIRQAEDHYFARDYPAANEVIQEAVKSNPNLPAVHFMEIDIQLKLGNVPAARKSLSRVKGLLAGSGQSEGDEARLLEAEMDIAIEQRQYGAAKLALDSAKHLPARFTARLGKKLARMVSFDPNNASVELRKWASRHG